VQKARYRAVGRRDFFELDNQAPLSANEVGIVPTDGRLANEFKAADLSIANAHP